MFTPLHRDYEEWVCSHCGNVVRVKKGEKPPEKCYACNDGQPISWNCTLKPGELPPIVRI